MSLKTCKEFLSHCDTLKTKKIILIHLSDKNSDEQKMIFEINKITGVETVAALPGDVYELSNRPF
jgi:ribonuclease BN (tRNA processing enzyme)